MEPLRHDHFSENAAAYAAHRPSYPPALADLLTELAPRRELAWDAGCGSGQLSLSLTDRFAHVCATDASPEQIAHASRHPSIAYWCERAERSSLRSESVDLAVTAQAAHWFDLGAYYAEVRRVTRRGSIVALVTYGIMRIDPEIDTIFQRFDAGALRSHWPPGREHVENRYRTLPFPFPELSAPPLEICTVWTRSELLGYVETWSAVQRLVRANGRAAVNALHRELAAAWRSESETRRVRWPLSLRLGRL